MASNQMNQIDMMEPHSKAFGQRSSYGSQAGIEQYVGKRMDNKF